MCIRICTKKWILLAYYTQKVIACLLFCNQRQCNIYASLAHKHSLSSKSFIYFWFSIHYEYESNLVAISLMSIFTTLGIEQAALQWRMFFPLVKLCEVLKYIICIGILSIEHSKAFSDSRHCQFFFVFFFIFF